VDGLAIKIMPARMWNDRKEMVFRHPHHSADHS
jgi:hypothetical protein